MPHRMIRRSRPAVSLLACLFVVAACGGDVESTDSTSPATTDPTGTLPSTSAPSTVPEVAVEPMATYQVMEVYDPMINNFLAATFLVPEGWGYQGGIHWDPNMRPLAAPLLQVFDPTGDFVLQSFFPVKYSWTRDTLPNSQGQPWLGTIMQPARPASDAVLDLVIPLLRVDYQVVSVTPVDPGLAPQAPDHSYDGAIVRIVYDTPGGPFEEDFHVVTQYFRGLLGVDLWVDNWGFDVLYSMRAPLGELDQMLPTLEMIAASVTPDMRWMANYLDVYAMYEQRNFQSIQLAAELSRTITQTYEEIGQIHRDVWANQQASQDRIHENFTDYIRDTQRVQPQGGGGPARVPRGVACQRVTDGLILILPDGSTCPVDTVRLPQVS